MNLSIIDELELFSKELQRYMSPDALEQLAKNRGFVKQKNKYRAQDLVALCIWLSQNIAHTSLTQLCSLLCIRNLGYFDLKDLHTRGTAPYPSG
jgi:hypothetical protein